MVALRPGAIRTAIQGSPRVQRLIHLRTLRLGPDEIRVAAKLELDLTLSFPGVATAINTTEGRLRSAVPACKVVYLEPDVGRPDGAGGVEARGEAPTLRP